MDICYNNANYYIFNYKMKEKIIYIIIVLVLLTLDLAIPIYSKSLSCDQCIINYKSKRTTSESIQQDYKLSIIDIYNDYLEGNCLIKFDKNMGYNIRNVSKLK